MNLVYVGKLVNTHGIKGEVKIISDFKYKKDVFIKDNIIIINNKNYKIISYRHHRIYDMFVLDDVNSIEQANKLKGSNVYIDSCNYKFNGYLDTELIGLDVYDNDAYMGKVVEILKTIKYDLLVINGKSKHMVPNIEQFIKNVDLNNKKIEIKYIKGLNNEN